MVFSQDGWIVCSFLLTQRKSEIGKEKQRAGKICDGLQDNTSKILPAKYVCAICDLSFVFICDRNSLARLLKVFALNEFGDKQKGRGIIPRPYQM